MLLKKARLYCCFCSWPREAWQASRGSKDDKKVLTFQRWDNAQRAGMEMLAKAYMEKNPGVTVKVQVTSWDMLDDVTGLYAEENPTYFEDHFSEI